MFTGIHSFDLQIMILVIIFGLAFHFGKKVVTSNPEVKDVAKKAVAIMAIKILKWFIKK